MQMIIFDIAKEMKTRILLGKNMGKRTSNKLVDFFQDLPDYSTILIDITGIPVNDYNFYSAAVGPLIKLLHEEKFKNKYVIIKVDHEQKPILLEGFLFFMFKKRFLADSNESFIENSLFIKLLNTQNNEMEFIGKLDTLQDKILRYINKEKEVSIRGVADKMEISDEETSTNLNDLIDKFFIYKINREREFVYCSFCKHLDEGE